MTDILPWLAANWLMLAIAPAFVIFLIVGVSYALGWYVRRLINEAFRVEADPWTDEALMGDVPHVPEKAKRRAA